MTIIYSPEYNSMSYLNLEQRKRELLGLKVCGSMELLAELELHAGIAIQDLSEPERLIAYHEAISKCAEDIIFGDSFDNDGIGVSRQLMSWIECLLLSGWTPETKTESKKLQSLALIKSNVACLTVAERWHHLTEVIRNRKILSDGDIIEVHGLQFVPQVIRGTLEVLGRQGHIREVPLSEAWLKDCELKVYHFKYRTYAYQWYLSNPDGLSDIQVTINSDSCLLNDMALSMGRPAMQSTSSNSNPQLLQLFKLGVSLFARPLNVYNLLSYLQVPGNPLGAVSRQLARVLADEGGINEKWHQTINGFDFTDEKGKDKRSEKLAFITMIDKAYSSDSIVVDDIKTYVGSLAHWCDKQIRANETDDMRQEQLVVLSAFCRSLHRVLADKDFISSEELRTHVDGIYQPQSFTHIKAEKDSADLVPSVTQLADDVDNVCWLDCVGGSQQSYPHDFLNSTELDELKQQGIIIPSKSQFYVHQRQLMLDALAHVRKKLVLVCWSYDGNSRQEEHPLITELKSRYGAAWNQYLIENEKPNLGIEEHDVSKLDIRPDYQLSGEGMKRLRREKESYSSIDTLIQHPFDYTLAHLLKLNEPQIGQLPDLDRTKGNVAHLFVEKLVERFGGDMPKMYLNMKDEEKVKAISEAIEEKGAILLLPEYRMEQQQFISLLRESVSALSRIMNDLKLTPVGCEIKMEVDFEDIGPFEANVDMVLQNSEGKYVIFDFKWSESKMFKEKLEQNKSIQLEFYRYAARQHYGSDVAATAYYQFPLMTLYTTDYPDSEHICHVKVKADDAQRNLFSVLRNSYKYRRHELDEGRIEESELMHIDNIPYTEVDGLYPLEVAYKTKDLKGCPYVKEDKPPFAKNSKKWDNGTKTPREIKTTHQILKGRLL